MCSSCMKESVQHECLDRKPINRKFSDGPHTFKTRTDPNSINHVSKMLNDLLSELGFGSFEFKPNLLNSVQHTVYTLVMFLFGLPVHYNVVHYSISSIDVSKNF